MKDALPRSPFQVSSMLTLVAITLVAIAVLLLVAWSSARWDTLLRDSAVPLDRLSQSRSFALQAELFTERLLAGDPGSSPSLVQANLQRASHAARAIVNDTTRLGRLEIAGPVSPELRLAVGEYLQVLDDMGRHIRARLVDPAQTSALDLRVMHASLRAAGVRVESVLLADMNGRYAFQRDLDRLIGLLLTAMMLVVIGLRYRASVRQRHALLRLVDSEARLRAFAYAMPDTAFILDREGRYIEVFGMGRSLTPYGHERMVGATVFDYFPRPQAENFVGVVRDALTRGEVVRYEYSLRLAGGTRWFEARVAPVDSMQRVVWVSRDVTERRRAEERIRLHAVALEGTRDGVMVTDLHGRIQSVNRAFTSITGYSEEEAIGKTPGLLKSGRHDPSFYRGIWSALLSGGYWQGEIWNRRRNGEVAPHWMSISAVGEQGHPYEHYVAVFTDISQLRQFEERVSHLANYDLLTDLPNRLRMSDCLETAIAAARRSHTQVGVMLVDLDRFKNVNDALGHALGDELLAGVAERLRKHLRHGDTLGRYGGDEFLLVLEQLRDAGEAAAVARTMNSALDQPFLMRGGQELYIKASIGISLYPEDGDTAAELIKDADAAMYEAKRLGRNTFRYYQEDLTRTANERLALESRLRRALDESMFEMYYQPLVALNSGEVLGAEALVRLRPDGGPRIGPADFIPVLEESGMIAELGRWVQREVCRQGRAWLDAGYDFQLLTLNLSAEEVRRGGVVDNLREVLAETGFPAEKLEVEITESGLMQRGSEALDFLYELKGLGVRLSIDDFGTGYSSLSYLKLFPVNKLKIDRGFITDIPEDQNDVQLTTTIIALARNLGLDVLAEGVETEAQRTFLAEKGCDAYQGYLCSPPVEAAVFQERFLHGRR
ncbi:putative bifunctional diguanylate cyclase/phosphodiesterase [Azoarcus olearius]|uniref:GGDEF/EAL/PAS-domain containing protein n=1 Tax=Azoarcus sp. (strain BH72) TaxID=418699 RepID=A1K7N9_AZOSB|nr:bifunctional diguanylate cyclase/phosphodiesterase [Azoarcus olearius]CAL94844.1 GGDEF/EAL/PAS-domain containing protein [Azoarcus olearius]